MYSQYHSQWYDAKARSPMRRSKIRMSTLATFIQKWYWMSEPQQSDNKRNKRNPN